MLAMASSGHESESKQLVEAQLRAALDVIPAYTWYAFDPSGGAHVREQTNCGTTLGLPKDHPLRFGIDIGAEWDSHIPLLHPDDHEEARRVWSTCLRTGSAGEMRFRVRNAAGEYRWFLTRAEPLRASDGTLLYWIGVNLDLEDRKQAEVVLQLTSRDLRRESKSKLEEAQRIANIGYWEWDVLTDRVNWSDETYRIYGLRPRERPMDLATVREKIHPEDWGAVSRALEEVLQRWCPLQRRMSRVFRPTGEVRVLHSQGVVQEGR